MSKKLELDPETENVMKQFREFLSSYNRLSEMCFTDCVHDMTTRKVLDSESACALNCMDKYLKMTQRISQRFQEYQMAQTDMSILAKQGAVGGAPLG
jgi:import inner membrane translocase subunit TIM9